VGGGRGHRGGRFPIKGKKGKGVLVGWIREKSRGEGTPEGLMNSLKSINPEHLKERYERSVKETKETYVTSSTWGGSERRWGKKI